MKTKHTPGPWRQQGFAVYSSENKPIFHTGFGLLPPSRSSEAEANAALIAAAPDLLQALDTSNFLEHREHCSPGRHTVLCHAQRTAIAKATGEEGA